MPCVSTPFGLRVADRQMPRARKMSASPRLLPVSLSLWQFPTRACSQGVPVRLAVLSPATSLVRCLRGAAKCSKQSVQLIQCLCPTPREQVEDVCYG